MSSIRGAERAGQVAVGLALGFATVFGHAAPAAGEPQAMTQKPATSETLSLRQQAMIPIAAFGAAGDMPRLSLALSRGLDAGLTVNDAKEVLVQLYAYAGFPRSLNALTELMTVLESRQRRGIQDAQGLVPSRAVPKGEALLAAGTANQTRLFGGPVKGALFEFAPAADEYLKTHLFGDIFERDNLDWQSRELATVAMLSALRGADSQGHARVEAGPGGKRACARRVEGRRNARAYRAERDLSAAGPRPRGHAGAVRHHQEPAGLLMAETIELGDVIVALTRKDVKHVHLTVHPPTGRVTLVAPPGTLQRSALPARGRLPQGGGPCSGS